MQLLDEKTTVTAKNLPDLLAKYEGATVTASGQEGSTGTTQMFKTKDGGGIFLTDDQWDDGNSEPG